MDAGNLFSASSTFSKSSLTIWKFSAHILLKPSLENFEHYFASVWDECNCAVVWILFGIAFLWERNCGHCWVFQICWHTKCSTLRASSSRIWNISVGNLFIVMLPKAHLTWHFRMSGSRWVITPSWLSVSLRSLLFSSSVYSCHLFLISSPVRHILLKPSLKDFEHYLASLWNECNCAIVSTFFDTPLLWDWKTDLFQYYGHCWVFQICWHSECSTFTASVFEITQLEFHHLH